MGKSTAFNAKGYGEALRKLWANMVRKKMYLTGGIGAMTQFEGFGIDYFLPQAIDEGGGYAETCASIGTMMLAERLLQVRWVRHCIFGQRRRPSWTVSMPTSWSSRSTMPS
jgi:DUF1680 family protein